MHDSEIRIAVIGDVHLCWDEHDVTHFNGSDYDLVLFVGDIAEYRHRSALKIARSIASLTVPTIVIPGNHDTANVAQLFAEVFQRSSISDYLGLGQVRRSHQLDRALGHVTLAGYSRHRVEIRGRELSIIAGRPHSMGGPRLTYRRYLRDAFRVASLDDSRRRLETLIDECGDEAIVFLAHNGPSGLGDRREDIWGCDFRPAQGDYGDPDLEAAIDYARAGGRRVLAVIAGHMHHALIGGGERRWSETHDGTLYLNAARVPRIESEGEWIHHHHIHVRIAGLRASFTAEKVSRKSALA